MSIKTFRSYRAFARSSAVATSLLVLLFAYAALSKLLDFREFQHQLYNQNISAKLAGILSWTLPAAELLAVALLLNRRLQWYGLVLSTMLMSVFTLYTGMVLAGVWSRIPCSCGGVLSRMSWTFHFWFNCIFLSCAILALSFQSEPWNRDTTLRST